MKQAVFGALIAAAGALSTFSGAQAQPYGGYGHGYSPPAYGAPAFDREDWERRMEWRAHRREFWRQQRELAERRAYEAGQRDAGRGHYASPAWVDR